MQNHTNFGDAKLIYNSGEVTGAKISGAHNVNNYVTPPPTQGGQVSWKNPPPKNTNLESPSDGYTLGKIQRYLSDKIDNATGNQWIGGNPPSSIKTKSGQNACWPKNYSVYRINQEKSVVLGKINTNTKINYINADGQYFYEIPATDGHPIVIIFDGNPNNGGTLNNIFPSNDKNLFY